MNFKRIFVIVLDSLGVGEAKDSFQYNSVGASTLGHINDKHPLYVPNLKKIGFMNLLNMTDDSDTEAYYTICHPSNKGVDSLSGHYEIVGVKNTEEFQIFPNAFDIELLKEISKITGRRVIGNVCCNDDTIIKQLGNAERNYESLIIYTSGDSNLQVAAHEESIPVNQLYQYCERIRALTANKEELNISRIIARPFTGTDENNYRFVNSAKKEYTIKPNNKTILDILDENKLSVIGIGKINDIFEQGINKRIKAITNNETVNKLLDIMNKDFKGLCLANLADFDEVYGHNRNVEGYAKAIEELDVNIPIIINKLNLDDLLIITADHGCDPTMEGSGHTREKVPLILYSRNFKEPRRLEERSTIADVAATITDNFKLDAPEIGTSLLEELK
jgi:phosphopentomutase